MKQEIDIMLIEDYNDDLDEDGNRIIAVGYTEDDFSFCDCSDPCLFIRQTKNGIIYDIPDRFLPANCEYTIEEV